MIDSKIFCNVPWYDLHIYWDGSFGLCCSEDHKIYNDSQQQYNIARMSISDWFNSEPVREFRLSIMQDRPLSPCRGCYLEEQHGGHSRRVKENQKSAIFWQAWDHSVAQSPSYHHFEHSQLNQGQTQRMPIDLHVNLGNFCNLACKMCHAEASSVIAAQEIKWGLADSKKYLGVDWTKDTQVWNSFKQQLLDIEDLQNIHFMGGETLLTDRVEDLIDTMTAHGRFDLCFSFVTNGTVIKPRLLEKLAKFKRVGVEVSIEATTEHNAYQRQGSDTAQIMHNIDLYRQWSNGTSTTVTLRPAPSLLTIGYYHTLLQYALDQQLLVKSNLCYHPQFLYAVNLPTQVKQLYISRYSSLVSALESVTVDKDFNASDPNNYAKAVKLEVEMCLDLLRTDTPDDAEQQLAQMVDHCKRWDKIYKLDAKQLYPELASVWERYAY